MASVECRGLDGSDNLVVNVTICSSFYKTLIFINSV